jgi:hypothetical protein
MASDPAAADPLVVDGALTTSGKVEIAYQAVHVADWLQTLQIARNPDRWSETNPILGEHPSVSDVNQYFLATAVGHALISHYIPSAKMTRVWQGTTIAIQRGYVIHNHSLGISIKFGD